MTFPSLPDLERALAAHRPPAASPPAGVAHAAVGAIFHAGGSGLELLFIHRAEHPADPWSGHMAFPGGRLAAGETDPFLAVVRETREELGLDLAAAGSLLGRLTPVEAMARGRRVPLVISPFVFAVAERPALRPNHEVQAALWVPVAFFLEGGNRTTFLWRGLGVPVPLPCYHVAGRRIWGLTLGMLDELMRLLRAAG